MAVSASSTGEYKHTNAGGLPFTRYPGEEYWLSFSPDGSHIAFVRNGEKQDNYDI